jgi:hypothetical protein
MMKPPTSTRAALENFQRDLPADLRRLRRRVALAGALEELEDNLHMLLEDPGFGIRPLAVTLAIVGAESPTAFARAEEFCRAAFYREPSEDSITEAEQALAQMKRAIQQLLEREDE